MGVAGCGSCDFTDDGFAGPGGAGDLLLDLAIVFSLAAAGVVFFPAVLPGVGRVRIKSSRPSSSICLVPACLA